MSITHSILSALNLKDPHLHFSEDCVSSQSIRGVDSLVLSGSLSYDPPPNIILGPEIMATSHDLILSLFKLYNGVVMV